MSSTKTTTRLPGILYWAMAIPAGFSLQYLPRVFIIPGDATATARRITEAALTYRLAILGDLLGETFFIFLALSLYNLFKDVDRKHARLLVVMSRSPWRSTSPTSSIRLRRWYY